MTSERRVVRPYVGLDEFQHVLDDWVVRIGGETVEPGTRKTVSSSSLRHDPTLLICAPDDDGLQELHTRVSAALDVIGLEAGQVELVVLASTPYLKLADVVHQQLLSDPGAIPRDLKLIGDESATRALCTPSGGCDIEVAFCLATKLDDQPLRPRRRGTWLGRVRFSLRTELGEIGFTPIPLTDDRREQLQLEPGTMRFVDVEPEALLAADVDDAVKLYLDDGVLGLLNQAPDLAGARFLQRQLYLDVMAAIVRSAPGISEFSSVALADLDEGILGRVLNIAMPAPKSESDSQKTQRREAALHLLKTDPERFIARLEAGVAPKSDLVQMLMGADE